jgi:hypothetical protein
VAAVRRLFWILLILAVGTVLLVAGFYLKISSDLPEMQTEGQILGLIGRSVEAYRGTQAHETGKKLIPFAVLPREALQAPVGQALLAAQGCSDYLAAPPTSSLDYWRQQLSPGGGPSACASTMATDLALRLLPPTAEHTEVAADRIRGVLGRDSLLAVWASALPFDPDGPTGVEVASQSLFHEAPQALDWERAAELVVASGAYDQVLTCKNPPHLRAMRDKFLAHAAELNPASANDIKAAAKQPLACELPHTK